MEIVELVGQQPASIAGWWSSLEHSTRIAIGAIGAASIGFIGLAWQNSRQIRAAQKLAREEHEKARHRLASAVFRDMTITMTALEDWHRNVMDRWRAGSVKGRSPPAVFTRPFPEPVLLFDLGNDLGSLSEGAGHWTAQVISLLRAIRSRREQLLAGASWTVEQAIDVDELTALQRDVDLAETASQIALYYLAGDTGLRRSGLDRDALFNRWAELRFLTTAAPEDQGEEDH